MMERAELVVRNMLQAIESPLYDVGYDADPNAADWRGYPTSHWNASAPPANTRTGPPQQTSPSVSPRMQTAWMKCESNVPLKKTIFRAIRALPSALPTSGEP